MLATAALVVALLALTLAGAWAVYAGVRSRNRRTRIYVGPEVASARVGDVVTLGRGRSVRIAAVDAGAEAVEVEPFTPPAAAKRGASADERALLLAFGYDPATHDVQPVTGGTHRGMQVLKDGERVRFYTEKQVKARLREPGAWKRALREARA